MTEGDIGVILRSLGSIEAKLDRAMNDIYELKTTDIKNLENRVTALEERASQQTGFVKGSMLLLNILKAAPVALIGLLIGKEWK